MYGYKIKKPSELPRVVWACKTAVERYGWKNTNKSDMIEFSLTKSEERTVTLADGATVELSGEVFSVLVGNGAESSYAKDGVKVDILSVAISIGGLTYEMKEFDEDDLADLSALLLPRFTVAERENELSSLEHLLYRFTRAYMEKGAVSEVVCAALALELLAELDKLVRRKVKAKSSKYVNYYVQKADKILLEHYSEKLTLHSVAREIGITPNYLSAIFKRSFGKGFSSRLFETRMKRAKELLSEGELSLFEISQKTGFDDESHLRRRFKQYYGVSIREYYCIDRELTLYHEKPIRGGDGGEST